MKAGSRGGLVTTRKTSPALLTRSAEKKSETQIVKDIDQPKERITLLKSRRPATVYIHAIQKRGYVSPLDRGNRIRRLAAKNRDFKSARKAFSDASDIISRCARLWIV